MDERHEMSILPFLIDLVAHMIYIFDLILYDVSNESRINMKIKTNIDN